MSKPLLRTPLYDLHHAAGAKIIPFAGYEMPVSYAGIKKEHQAVREKVGVFDVSHMGNFEFTGPQAMNYLELMTTNGVHKLEVGDVQYSSLCNEEGGMIDDILVYRYASERFQVIVNAGNKSADWDELASKIPPDGVSLLNKSEALGILAVQGPNAEALCEKILGQSLSEMAFYRCGMAQFGGEELLFSRTGYTGEDGFEFYLKNDLLVPFWECLLEKGDQFGLELCGLGARDTLRLEAGYSLYGQELSLDVHPLDSGLAWIVDLKTDFRGKARMVQRQAEGPRTSIIGLEMIEKGISRTGHAVCLGNTKIGEVTSGSSSPMTGKSIALARVELGKVKIGDEVTVMIREKAKRAQVVSRRFYVRGE